MFGKQNKRIKSRNNLRWWKDDLQLLPSEKSYMLIEAWRRMFSSRVVTRFTLQTRRLALVCLENGIVSHLFWSVFTIFVIVCIDTTPSNTCSSHCANVKQTTKTRTCIWVFVIVNRDREHLPTKTFFYPEMKTTKSLRSRKLQRAQESRDLCYKFKCWERELFS